MNVKIKLLNNGIVPKFSRDGDACLDCYANEETVIPPKARKLISLGFAIELPKGFEAVLRPRSGLSSKGIDSTIGTIDENYRGEVKTCLINNSPSGFFVHKGDRICQMAIRETPKVEIEITDSLSETERGENGFGSSGIS